jgi:hypothetical protein
MTRLAYIALAVCHVAALVATGAGLGVFIAWGG